MDKKLINKQIKKISNSSSLPLLIFMSVTVAGKYLLNYIYNSASYGSILKNGNVLTAIQYIVIYPILIPILLWIFYRVRGKRRNIRTSDLFAKPQRSAGFLP